MRYVSRHRLRRLMASASPLLFAGTVAIGSVLIATFRPTGPTEGTANALTTWVPFGVVTVLAIVLAIQTWAEYRKRTFEPTLAFKLGDIFDSEEMIGARSRAAKTLKDNSSKLGSSDFSCLDLDEIFDFFESVGFYMNGDQITPEVAHHWYHYWLRGYYSAGYEYIAAKQKKEVTQWKSIKKLLCATNQIELDLNKNATKNLLEGDELNDFLNEEIGMIFPLSRRSTAA
jgi:hypothetical protein